MKIRGRSLLILLGFVLPASLAGTILSAAIKHSYQESQKHFDDKRLYVAAGQMQLAYVAAIQYAVEHKDRWPDADRWEEELTPYLPSRFEFTLPTPYGTRPRRIAINPRCAGKSTGDSGIILFFESISPERNAHDDLRSLPTSGDGSRMYHLQFAGGYGYNYPLEYCDTMRTDPTWVQRNMGAP